MNSGSDDKRPAPDDGGGNNRGSNRAFYQYAGLAMSLAITLLLSFLVGFYAGSWLDRRLGTSPWLTLVGIFFGIVAGFRSVLREFMPELFAGGRRRSGGGGGGKR